MACEIVAETEEPLSRHRLLTWCVRALQTTLSKRISRSTVWRMLHEAAIKPWQYEHWLFPKDPQFAEKTGPILDLYAGMWEGESLGRTNYVLSMDEKDEHPGSRETPAGMRKHRPNGNSDSADRIGIQEERSVAVFGGVGRASWDRRGTMREEDGDQAVWSVGGSGAGAGALQGCNTVVLHRGQRLVASSARRRSSRMRRRDRRIVLVHTPIHASWLNQVEIYFSIIQRKVLTPNDFCQAGSDPRAPGVIRGVEQSHTKAVRVEVYSTRHAELAKTRVAAFSSSSGCVG